VPTTTCSRPRRWRPSDAQPFHRRTAALFATAAYAGLRLGELRALRWRDVDFGKFGTLAVQAFALSDVKAYMGHADIATTMIYVHHVPQVDAAEQLSTALRAAAGPAVTDEAEGRNVSAPAAID
jgi:integrase